MESLRQAKLEVRTHAQQMPGGEEDTFRTWLISVQTFVSGSPVHIDAVASSVDIVVPSVEAGDGQRFDLYDVEYLGLVDPSIAVYRLEELEPVDSLPNNHHQQVRVKVVPKFSSSVYNFYMLDDILTSLVGKRYLLHPKYALTLVLAYARQHNLVTEKFIICDSFLAAMFGGAQWVKIKSLWTQILKLISPVEPVGLWNTVNFENSFGGAEEPCKPSQSTLDVSIDGNSELFPGDWPSKQTKLSRTTSSPCIVESCSSSSASSSSSSSKSTASGASKSSSRSLRRHKTL